MSEESIFINRELSWLDFNRRVLVLGKDKNVPLAEQLKFLAIYGSNLDEFFMVRVGSLQERANLMRGKKEKRENKTNMTAEEQLAAIMPKTAQLQEDCDKYYAKALENLAVCGYRKVDFEKLSKEDEHFWKKYFQSELFPILSPQIVDSRHPFPFLRNKEIYLGVLLHEKHTSEHTLGIVPISSQMERMHFVRKDNETCFALTEELVLHYAALIFGKENVQEKCLFRVTRNADIDVKEGMMDHDIDYREIMADLLKRRRKLAAVRLQVIPPAPQVAPLLCSRLELTHKRVFVQKSPLDLSFFYKLTGKMEAEGNPELFYPTARPMLPPQDYDLAAEVEKHDVLLSYPYQSIRPFIAMLKKAARDPEVISIKMTLYRLAKESKVIKALICAAKNGKKVTVVIELLARFDEASIINWSKRMQDAGIHVIFGVEGLKIHSKLVHIGTRHGDIACISTGNFHEGNARMYTDYTIMTAHRPLVREVNAVFDFIEKPYTPVNFKELLVSPNDMRKRLIALINKEIKNKEQGKEAYILAKVNHITDRALIEKLYEASTAGVQVELVVRGNCSLVTGIAGISENIHINGIIDRYLEHSRIFIFANGGEEKYYIGSADWMPRNLDNRIEVLAPVYDKEIQADLKRIVCYGYRDTAKGRIVDGTGENRPWENQPSTLCKDFTPALAEAETATVVFRSQEELYRKYKNTL